MPRVISVYYRSKNGCVYILPHIVEKSRGKYNILCFFGVKITKKNRLGYGHFALIYGANFGQYNQTFCGHQDNSGQSIFAFVRNRQKNKILFYEGMALRCNAMKWRLRRLEMQLRCLKWTLARSWNACGKPQARIIVIGRTLIWSVGRGLAPAATQ